MATPDTKHSLVILKQGPYRGGTRIWSNRYHFEGALPADAAHWTTLADNVTAAEKLIYRPDLSIVEAVGYNAGTATSTNPHGDAIFTKAYTLAGTASAWASSQGSSGDSASLVRYSTDARTPKNHPVYLFNYYHGCYATAADPDILSAALKTALEAYAAAWVTGFTDGTVARERCGPRGAVSTGYRVDPYVRHRDFPT